ncbi:MAG: hypothetical protein PHY47_18820 [Lachnospiraceae bacterium]|nr:hypothetical protein [Lachnospiraceae bacterium]
MQTTLKLAIKERLCSTVVLLSSLLAFWGLVRYTVFTSPVVLINQSCIENRYCSSQITEKQEEKSSPNQGKQIDGTTLKEFTEVMNGICYELTL